MKLVLVVLFSFAGSLWAQTATLQGIVTDESGAVIPKANVTLKGTEGLTRTVMSGDDGSYAFLGLPPGAYTVEAVAPELSLPNPQKISLRVGVQYDRAASYSTGKRRSCCQYRPRQQRRSTCITG